MKKLFFIFLLVLIVGSIDAQQFEKIADFKTSRTSSTYDLLAGNKNLLITGRDITSFNGISSPNGIFLFDGINYVSGTIVDDLCCGNYKVDPTSRVYGSVSTGLYRIVYGAMENTSPDNYLDSGFIATVVDEQNGQFIKSKICYSNIYDTLNETGTIRSAIALGKSKVFFGGDATTINGFSCPFTFIYDIETGEIDTLGGRWVENGPNRNVVQAYLSPDKSKVVCLDAPNYSRSWHISSYNLKTKTWSKEKEPSNIVPYYMWYHKKELYLSAQFLNADTSCHSNVLQQWARQKSDGSWEYVCLSNDQNKTWYIADAYASIDVLPDSVMFVGMAYGTSTFNEWNDMLHPIPRVDRPDYYETAYALDTFQGVVYAMGATRFLKVVGQILPLTWTGFTAVPLKNNVELNWSVANVSNNDHFEVERSTDSRNFQRVGTVHDNGASSYEYVDNGLPYGTFFYRIKQVDKDGKSSYSTTLKVSVGAVSAEQKIMVFPNPATSQIFLSEDVKLVQIFSADGRELKKIENYKRNNSINVSGFNSGLYLIKTDKGQTLKVIITK